MENKKPTNPTKRHADIKDLDAANSEAVKGGLVFTFQTAIITSTKPGGQDQPTQPTK